MLKDHQIYFEFGPQDQNHLWYFWKCKHVMCTWQGQSAEIKPCFNIVQGLAPVYLSDHFERNSNITRGGGLKYEFSGS